MTRRLLLVRDGDAPDDQWNAADRRALARLLRFAGRVAAGGGRTVERMPVGRSAWSLPGGHDRRSGTPRLVLRLDQTAGMVGPQDDTAEIGLETMAGRVVAAARLWGLGNLPGNATTADRRRRVGAIAAWTRDVLDAAGTGRTVDGTLVDDAARALSARSSTTPNVASLMAPTAIVGWWTSTTPWTSRDERPWEPPLPHVVRTHPTDPESEAAHPVVEIGPATSHVEIAWPFDPVARMRAEASLSRLSAMADGGRE